MFIIPSKPFLERSKEYEVSACQARGFAVEMFMGA